MQSRTLVLLGVLTLAGCATRARPSSTSALVSAMGASDAEMQHMDSHALLDALVIELRAGGVVRLATPLSQRQVRSEMVPGYTDMVFVNAEVTACVLRVEYRGASVPATAAGAQVAPGRARPFSWAIRLVNVDPNTIVADEAVGADRYRRPTGTLHLVRLYAAEGGDGVTAGRSPSNREARLFVRDADSAVRTAGIVRELTVRCRR